MLNKESKEIIIFLSIVALIILIFAFLLFRIIGVRVVVGIILMSLPFYLILNKFELEISEKIIFSILLGLTIFPALVYAFGLIMSFKLAIIIVFFMLIAMGFSLRKYKPKR